MGAQRRRRSVLVLSEDSDWLRELHPRPEGSAAADGRARCADQAGCGSLRDPGVRTCRGRLQGLAADARAVLLHSATTILCFFSALAEHRLTDLAEPFATVLVGFGSRQLQSGKLEVAGRQVRCVRTRRPVFSSELGVGRWCGSRAPKCICAAIRPARSSMPCGIPELSGATETWVTAWGRGMRYEQA